MMFIILGSANSVNFTDGLDGLATGSLIISFSAITIFTYIAGNSVYSSYLYLPFISNVGEIVVFISALIGSLLGFLCITQILHKFLWETRGQYQWVRP